MNNIGTALAKLLWMVFVCWGLSAPAEEEQILVVEQNYKIIEYGKDGPDAKDIRQKLYLAKDWVRIDEYAGQTKAPSETYLIDFQAGKIINLDNENLTTETEEFSRRRKRIDERKQGITDDLKNMKDGKQKEKTEDMYRALLDDKRKFKHLLGKDLAKHQKDLNLESPAAIEKEIAGIKCELVWIIDKKDPNYIPLQTYIHPELRVAYDSAEVLYLLQLIGHKMVQYLQENKDLFHRLPMEMHLKLAAGGTLDTMVTSVAKVNTKELSPDLRSVPPGYNEKRKRQPPNSAAVVEAPE